jgi:hypothetical protein
MDKRYGLSFSAPQDGEGLVATIIGPRLSFSLMLYPDHQGGLSLSGNVNRI